MEKTKTLWPFNSIIQTLKHYCVLCINMFYVSKEDFDNNEKTLSNRF